MNSPHRILVIDDNRAIHDDFRKIFCPERPILSASDEAAFFGGSALSVNRPPDFELEYASQGLDGCALLERLVAAGTPPTVAFVDVRMPPGIDGIETSERLWKIFPELQIVICTAYSDYSWEEMIERLPQRDRLLILKKPFAAIEALQLASALREKSLLAQRARHHLAETERIVEERTRELRAAHAQIIVEMNQRLEAERLLLRSQRLESIGTLATGVAHDLNNMLSPISLAAELLSDEWPAATREELIATIAKSAKRAAGIVRQVLTFARGAEGERMPLQTVDLVREVHNLIRESFPRNIQIERKISSDLWVIEGDPTQFSQILINLCVNARDAMPDGGTLSIAVDNYEGDTGCRVARLGGSPGRYVALRVSDTGTGIPAAVIDKIFDPFFTTKEVGKGTGLGLSTIVGIVKSHDGFIDVQSQPGEGTTFEIFLPALTDAAPSQTVTEQIFPADGEGQLILLVDDEEEILLLLETVLVSRGYRVVTASDGAEALNAFFKYKDEIDTVVTDMMMPLMDGMALCRALRGISPDVNIIATSGNMEESRTSELQSLNIRHVLAKPYQSSALLQLIHDALTPTPSWASEPCLRVA